MDAPVLNQLSTTLGLSEPKPVRSPRHNQNVPQDAASAAAPERLAEDRVTLSNTSRQDILKEEGQKLARELTAAEERQINQLAARDAQVKAHERAHKAVGGQYTGAISYVYQEGPDGKRYAVGGEVPIDASPVSGDPQATIDKMNVVKAAALAPSDPSAQDRRVASQAGQTIAEARLQLNEERREEAQQARAESGESREKPNLAARTYENVESSGLGAEDERSLVSTRA
ncbi:MAG: hypothetical protein C9356_07305 [Oleiphilus sp.]|nr:MAG: hypothetical protein C9356_07305 [Oleiphilus sp.]